MLRIETVAFTHQGAVRPANEDTVAVGDWLRSTPMTSPERLSLRLDRPRLLLVADGMGGHAAGEVASRAMAEALVRLAPSAEDPAAVAAMIATANADLYELMRERPALTGMGTTVAGLVLTPARGLVFNVGDSRVHRVWPGRIEQLSTDDTPGPKQADGRTAVMTSSLITQVLGGGRLPEALVPHVLEVPLENGATYLVSSDGLTDLVAPDAIAAAIDQHQTESVERLFHLAMSGGGTDNVSLVLARITQEPAC